jgi:hypothetical protein
MCIIDESNVLLRVRAELPTGFKVATETFREGWCRMRTGGIVRLKRKVQARGWNFLKISDGALRSGVGDTSQEAIANALSQALEMVDAKFNAVEVERVELTQYPWFFLARVRVYPYRIQAGAELPVTNEAASAPMVRRRPAKASELFPQFGSAMPMLKGMLTISRVAEIRA